MVPGSSRCCLIAGSGVVIDGRPSSTIATSSSPKNHAVASASCFVGCCSTSCFDVAVGHNYNRPTTTSPVVATYYQKGGAVRAAADAAEGCWGVCVTARLTAASVSATSGSSRSSSRWTGHVSGLSAASRRSRGQHLSSTRRVWALAAPASAAGVAPDALRVANEASASTADTSARSTTISSKHTSCKARTQHKGMQTPRTYRRRSSLPLLNEPAPKPRQRDTIPRSACSSGSGVTRCAHHERWELHVLSNGVQRERVEALRQREVPFATRLVEHAQEQHCRMARAGAKEWRGNSGQPCGWPQEL